ncbi:MAG: GWxTD domain-containing protein [Bacteroidales bacterium]
MVGRKILALGSGFLLLWLSGCALTRTQSASEETDSFLTSLYNPSELSLHPHYSVFHESENVSVLYLRAYPAELRFNQANEEAEYRAEMSISYQLIRLNEEGQSEALVDSATVVYRLRQIDELRQAFFASMTIPAATGNHYLLRLEARDVVRGSRGLEYVYVDKRSLDKSQNFKVVSLFSGYPKFMNFFTPGEHFTIQYRDRALDSLVVERFSMTGELPRPPVNSPSDFVFPDVPDTVMMLAVGDTADRCMDLPGMYLVKARADAEEGLVVFNFGMDFPEIKSPAALMEPLFYLATQAEYRDLRQEANRKLAVDDYWLDLGTSLEKSRELIRIYYNRVLYSNLYFTTNTEGWKTDRGMIFILFGPPNRIRKTGTEEQWYYMSRRKSSVVAFRFERRSDPFSSEAYEWIRTTESQSARTEAIQSWRKGRVYAMGN